MSDLKINEVLKQLRQEKNLTLRELGVKTGLTTQYISDLESGRINTPSLKKIAEFAEAFNLTVVDVLLKAGHSPSCKTELEKEIKLTPDLTPANKEILLSVYRSLKNKE